MVIQDLTAGQDVVFEICFYDQKYEFPSKVVGANEAGAIVQPFVYQGMMVDFEMFKQRGACINMHCTDSENKQRYVFQNISSAIIDYKEQKYYMVTVATMNTIAYDSERRRDERLSIDRIKGMIILDESKESFPIRLYNISERGLAFTVPKSFPISEEKMMVRFIDTLYKKKFELDLLVSVIHQEEKEERKMYGCRIVNSDNTLLAYMYLLHRLEREKQNKQS